MLGLNLLLLRYRAALSFVVPAALCVDAIHNAIVVARLYEERGKEWELEKQQAMLDEVMPVLQGISRSCEIRDKAFWPHRLAQVVLPVACEAADEEAALSAALNDEDETLGMLGILPRWTSGDAIQPSSALNRSGHRPHRESSTSDAHNSSASSVPAAQGIAPCSRALQWLTDRAENAARFSRGQVDQLIDRGLRSLRAAVPMPCMEVKRRSALRVRLQWHGFTKPIIKPHLTQTCEVYL